MKYTGEVIAQETTGESCRVKIGNVTRPTQSWLRPFLPAITCEMPFRQGKSFLIGRTVEITITPKGKL